jgi:hypothetical protein
MADSNVPKLEELSLSSSNDSIRRPYFGQCHCGFVRYIAWLAFPSQVPYLRETPQVQLIRKCNCTMCHKLGFFHVRVANSPNDFALLSPLNPLSEMSSYSTTGKGHWLFCKTCGVYCFQLIGELELNEIDLAGQGVDLKAAKVNGDGMKVKVVQPKTDGWKEEKENWFRINANTLDAKQEDLDLREWLEKKWIQYVNALEDAQGCSYDRPYLGGAY